LAEPQPEVEPHPEVEAELEDAVSDREEESEKARTAFLSLAEDGGDERAINASAFNKLIEKLGTVYCEEEHSKTAKKLQKPGGKIKYEADAIAEVKAKQSVLV
jgi:hypothetical protein